MWTPYNDELIFHMLSYSPDVYFVFFSKYPRVLETLDDLNLLKDTEFICETNFLFTNYNNSISLSTLPGSSGIFTTNLSSGFKVYDDNKLIYSAKPELTLNIC